METSEPVTSFSDALDAVERLTADEQEELTEIIRRRLAQRGHQRILRDIEEAREELKAGLCKVVSVDELMREILS